MLELLFPGLCLACTWQRRDRFGLCPACLEKVRWLEKAACIRCGRTLHPQGKCPASRHRYRRILALAAYREPWRRTVWAVKFGLDRQVALEVSIALMNLAAELEIKTPDLVVPAPGATLKWQRFDGVAFLARQLASHGKAGFSQCLERLPGRRPQVGLDWFQRRQGMIQFLRLRSGVKVEGKRIWLVDDVYTTGTTADASAQALLKSGAVSVTVVTLAN